MSNIQIRIDEKDKKAAKKIFDKLGLDMSSAIKLFLKQTTLRKGLPFLLTTENGLTLEKEAEIIEAAKEAQKGQNITKAMGKKEAIAFLDKL